MSKPSHTDMPPEFASHIHQALKAWHTRDPESPLDTLRLVRKAQTQFDGVPASTFRNQVLLDGLERLKQTDAEAANLLQRRFVDDETAQEVAHSLNVSEHVIYQRQRKALLSLAETIWSQELALRQHHTERIEMRLELPTYTRLFGIEAACTALRTQLETPAEPWIISLEGMGGIGKTTLADALCRELAYREHFQDLAWITARDRLFRLPGAIIPLEQQPALTIEELLDRLIAQFDLSSLQRESDARKRQGVRHYLRTTPCLIVLDNLETIADYRLLVTQLRDLAAPSKFLLTSRESLRGEGGIYIWEVAGLSQADTLALIRYEAALQGLHDLTSAPDEDLSSIYTVSGGNPLATKMIIGQTHIFSLDAVLQRFQGMAGRVDKELLRFIHQQAWETLLSDCQRVLQAMILVADDGGQLEQISAAAGLSLNATAACLARLATLSLIQIRGNLHEKWYALHPLTRHFLIQQAE